jgi:hypothetical protein
VQAMTNQLHKAIAMTMKGELEARECKTLLLSLPVRQQRAMNSRRGERAKLSVEITDPNNEDLLDQMKGHLDPDDNRRGVIIEVNTTDPPEEFGSIVTPWTWDNIPVSQLDCIFLPPLPEEQQSDEARPDDVSMELPYVETESINPAEENYNVSMATTSVPEGDKHTEQITLNPVDTIIQQNAFWILLAVFTGQGNRRDEGLLRECGAYGVWAYER